MSRKRPSDYTDWTEQDLAYASAICLNIFRTYDFDDSGTLQITELKNFLHRCGVELTPAKISAIVNQLDLDGDGQMNFAEFMGFLGRIYQMQYYGTDSGAPTPQGGSVVSFDLRSRSKTPSNKSSLKQPLPQRQQPQNMSQKPPAPQCINVSQISSQTPQGTMPVYNAGTEYPNRPQNFSQPLSNMSPNHDSGAQPSNMANSNVHSQHRNGSQVMPSQVNNQPNVCQDTHWWSFTRSGSVKTE